MNELLDLRGIQAGNRAELEARFGVPAKAWRLDRISWKAGPPRSKAVFRARSPEGHDLALKSDSATDRLEGEYQALATMRDAIPDVARPIFYAPERATYALEWLEGESILARIHAPSRLQDLEDAGRWLGRLQDATEAGTQRFDSVPSLDHICNRRFRVPDPWPQYETVLGSLRRRATFLADVEVPVSLVHGDLALQNLMRLSDGRVIAVDPNTAEVTYVLRDLVKLLFSLRLRRSRARRKGRPWPDDDTRDRRAVLRGWGRMTTDLAPVLRYMEDLQIVRAWIELRITTLVRENSRKEFDAVTKMVRQRGLMA